MASKKHRPEEAVAKLRQVDVLSSGLLPVQRMAVAFRVDLGDRVVDGAVKAIRAGEGLVGQMLPLQVAPDAKVST